MGMRKFLVHKKEKGKKKLCIVLLRVLNLVAVENDFSVLFLFLFFMYFV